MNHRLELAADGAQALELPPASIEGYRRLVAETDSLFGARHYREYHFLLALSDPVGHFGLEHHESSENRLPERSFIDAELAKTTASLLPHEMVHSWNSKHRRPARLTSPDYNARSAAINAPGSMRGSRPISARVLPASVRVTLDARGLPRAPGGGRRRCRAFPGPGLAVIGRCRNERTATLQRRRCLGVSPLEYGRLLYDGGESCSGWKSTRAIRDLSKGQKSSMISAVISTAAKGASPRSSSTIWATSSRHWRRSRITTGPNSSTSGSSDRPNTHRSGGWNDRAGRSRPYHDQQTTMDAAVEKSGKWGFDVPMVILT